MPWPIPDSGLQSLLGKHGVACQSSHEKLGSRQHMMWGELEEYLGASCPPAEAAGQHRASKKHWAQALGSYMVKAQKKGRKRELARTEREPG